MRGWVESAGCAERRGEKRFEDEPRTRGPKDNVGVIGNDARDDRRHLIHLLQRHVGGTGDGEDDAHRPLNRKVEERRRDGRKGRVACARLAETAANAHESRAGVCHDRAHVGKVDVDEAWAKETERREVSMRVHGGGAEERWEAGTLRCVRAQQSRRRGGGLEHASRMHACVMQALMQRAGENAAANDLA